MNRIIALRRWENDLPDFSHLTYKRAAEETRAGDNQETLNLKSKETSQ